jgi:hypothetical protein
MARTCLEGGMSLVLRDFLNEPQRNSDELRQLVQVLFDQYFNERILDLDPG